MFLEHIVNITLICCVMALC